MESPSGAGIPRQRKCHFCRDWEHVDPNIFKVPSEIVGQSDWQAEWGKNNFSIIGPAEDGGGSDNEQASNNAADSAATGDITAFSFRRYLTLYCDNHTANIAAIRALYGRPGKNEETAKKIFQYFLAEEFVFFKGSPNASSVWNALFNDPFLFYLRAYYRYDKICEKDKKDTCTDIYSGNQRFNIAVRYAETLIGEGGDTYFDLWHRQIKASGTETTGGSKVGARREGWFKNLLVSNDTDIEVAVKKAIKSARDICSEAQKEDQKKELDYLTAQAITWFVSRHNRGAAKEIEILSSGRPPWWYLHERYVMGIIAFAVIFLCSDFFPRESYFLLNAFFVACAFFVAYTLCQNWKNHNLHILIGIVIGHFFLAQADVLLKNLVLMPWVQETYPRVIIVDIVLLALIYMYFHKTIWHKLSLFENDIIIYARSLKVVWYSISISVTAGLFFFPLLKYAYSIISKEKSLDLFNQTIPILGFFHWSVLAVFVGIFFQMFWKD